MVVDAGEENIFQGRMVSSIYWSFTQSQLGWAADCTIHPGDPRVQHELGLAAATAVAYHSANGYRTGLGAVLGTVDRITLPTKRERWH